MAAFTRGLRVLIPLVLDSKEESERGILTPALCRHATTFATARLRNDCLCAGGFTAADGDLGMGSVAMPTIHAVGTGPQ